MTRLPVSVKYIADIIAWMNEREWVCKYVGIDASNLSVNNILNYLMSQGSIEITFHDFSIVHSDLVKTVALFHPKT